MCIALTKKGVVCKKKNVGMTDYCHLHNKTEKLKNYIIELENEKEKFKKSIVEKDGEIERLICQVRQFKDENKRLISSNMDMRCYYENYKKIIDFERFKLGLNFERISQKDLDKFNYLRQIRNKLCHPYD